MIVLHRDFTECPEMDVSGSPHLGGPLCMVKNWYLRSIQLEAVAHGNNFGSTCGLQYICFLGEGP